MSRRISVFLAGVLSVILLGLLIAAYVIFAGAYNVAATEPHTDLVYSALDRAMQNSVEARADTIALPEAYTGLDPAAGAASYAGMCQQCHGGIGAEPAVWAKDMYPRPPALENAAEHWTPEEIFWILRHGIKMSGMPAFGPSHSDKTLWELTRFVKQLPGMTAEQYAAYTAPPAAAAGTEAAAPQGSSDGHDHVH